jgi:D-sedoheptulose 7-phosphate isomerase
MDIKELIQALRAVNEHELSHLKRLIDSHKEIIIIGNGGSNAIASHMAVDYTKFLSKKCFIPNASDMMTMIVNDYGVEQMYSKFIEYNYTKDSLVILISSSGNSQNIINANSTASDLGLEIITLTGFDHNNKLKSASSGLLNIWVDSKSYGVVEMAHHSILHSAV